MAWQTAALNWNMGLGDMRRNRPNNICSRRSRPRRKLRTDTESRPSTVQTLANYKAAKDRTVYIIDLRTPEEYRAGHRPDSSYGWGVQLVQGMDKYAATRRSRVVLVDNYLVRALMTASWLVEADWPETYVLANPFRGVELATGDYKPAILGLGKPAPRAVDVAKLAEMLEMNATAVVDVAGSSSYMKGHIPGAWFISRARLEESIKIMPPSPSFVVTGNDTALAALSAQDLAKLTGKPVSVLAGGNAAWRKAGLPLKSGMDKARSAVDDIFVQPFLWGQLYRRAPVPQGG